MSLSTKVLIFINSVLFLGITSFVVYHQIQLSHQQQAIEAQTVKQKELADDITRSQNDFATKKDIEQILKNNEVNLKAIQEDLDKLHAEITAVNVIVTSSKEQKVNNAPSTTVGPSNPNKPTTPTVSCDGKQIPCPSTDPNGYYLTRQNLDLNEDFGNVKVPWGQVGFSAWLTNPWNYDVYPREYHVTSVVGTDENQRTYFYNKFAVSVNGKYYDIHINSAETKQEYPEAKFSWFNPHLFLTTGMASNLSDTFSPSFNIGATLGIASYGRFKSNPDISILAVGGGYDTSTRKPALIINPINYNIGKLLPSGLANNTYFGPSLQINTSGNIFAGANLSMGF